MIYKNVLENKTYYLPTTSSTNDEKLDEFKKYFENVYQTPKRRIKKVASSSESAFKTVKKVLDKKSFWINLSLILTISLIIFTVCVSISIQAIEYTL